MVRSLLCVLALSALTFVVGCGSGAGGGSTPKISDKDSSKQLKVMTPGGAPGGTKATKTE